MATTHPDWPYWQQFMYHDSLVARDKFIANAIEVAAGVVCQNCTAPARSGAEILRAQKIFQLAADLVCVDAKVKALAGKRIPSDGMDPAVLAAHMRKKLDAMINQDSVL